MGLRDPSYEDLKRENEYHRARIQYHGEQEALREHELEKKRLGLDQFTTAPVSLKDLVSHVLADFAPVSRPFNLGVVVSRSGTKTLWAFLCLGALVMVLQTSGAQPAWPQLSLLFQSLAGDKAIFVAAFAGALGGWVVLILLGPLITGAACLMAFGLWCAALALGLYGAFLLVRILYTWWTAAA